MVTKPPKTQLRTITGPGTVHLHAGFEGGNGNLGSLRLAQLLHGGLYMVRPQIGMSSGQMAKRIWHPGLH